MDPLDVCSSITGQYIDLLTQPGRIAERDLPLPSRSACPTTIARPVGTTRVLTPRVGGLQPASASRICRALFRKPARRLALAA